VADQAPPENVHEPIAEATVEASATPALPEKIRAHALAKLLGVTSKQVLAEAAALGTELRSAQSSLSREIAERIHATVTGAVAAPEPAAEPVPDAGTETVGPETAGTETAGEQAAEETAPAEKPAPRKRARKKAAPKAAKVVEPVESTEVAESAAAPAESVETPGAGESLFTNADLTAESDEAAAPAVVQAPLFLQPEAAAEPAPRRRRSRRAAAAPEPTEVAEATEEP